MIPRKIFIERRDDILCWTAMCPDKPIFFGYGKTAGKAVDQLIEILRPLPPLDQEEQCSSSK